MRGEIGASFQWLVATIPVPSPDASPSSDTLSSTGAPCETALSAAVLRAHSGSVLEPSTCLSLSDSSGATLPDLSGVVARVSQVELHPLLEGEVSQARVLHEEIARAGRQQELRHVQHVLYRLREVH